MNALAKAERHVAAIDKRIDAVRAELHRVAGIDPYSFDVMTDDGMHALTHAYQIGWDRNPALKAIDTSLYSRRYYAAELRDKLAAKEARAAERRELAEQSRQRGARLSFCPTCGQLQFAA